MNEVDQLVLVVTFSLMGLSYNVNLAKLSSLRSGLPVNKIWLKTLSRNMVNGCELSFLYLCVNPSPNKRLTVQAVITHINSIKGLTNFQPTPFKSIIDNRD